jgi:hypothetical protein
MFASSDWLTLCLPTSDSYIKAAVTENGTSCNLPITSIVTKALGNIFKETSF